MNQLRSEHSRTITDLDRAAILLLSMGEENAAGIKAKVIAEAKAEAERVAAAQLQAETDTEERRRRRAGVETGQRQ